MKTPTASAGLTIATAQLVSPQRGNLHAPRLDARPQRRGQEFAEEIGAEGQHGITIAQCNETLERDKKRGGFCCTLREHLLELVDDQQQPRGVFFCRQQHVRRKLVDLNATQGLLQGSQRLCARAHHAHQPATVAKEVTTLQGWDQARQH